MTTIVTASRQYASRPADERYPSLAAMVDAAVQRQTNSKAVVRNWKDLAFTGSADGVQLTSKAKGVPANLTHWAFGQAARSLGAPAAFLRDDLSPQLAADVLNYRIAQTAPGTDVNLMFTLPTDTSTAPIVRACTSDTYGRVWDAQLYGAIAQTFGNSHDADAWKTPPTWSGEPAGAYMGDRDSFLILVNGGSIVTDPSLRSGGDNGQMYRGVLVRNSEVGASSIVIDRILFRFVCGNHMLWGAVIDRTFRRRHVGDGALRDTMREIYTTARTFAQTAASHDEAIIKGLITHEIAQTREAVIDELRKIGNISKADAEAAYDRCEATEAVSPRSYWGIAQGLTRVSQDSGYQDDRFQLDTLAAQILRRGRQLVAA